MSSTGLAPMSKAAQEKRPAAEKHSRLDGHNISQEQGIEPCFFIRDVPVFGDVVLAPMAGFSDIPHRALCRSFGSAMHYTEFIAAKDILHGTRKAKRLLEFDPGENPTVIQIFGSDPKVILSAAKKAEELEPTIIDINLGCSTRRVSGRGAGVGMMRKPLLVAETFSLLTKNLGCPVTAKIRLGWEDNRNYLEIAHILHDCGVSLIAVHARTKEQKYSGQADWEAIAEVKQSVNLPIIGNGDVNSPADIDNMLHATGCDGVMIGRGAIGNPWLFSRINRDTLCWSDYADVMKMHLEMMLEFYGKRGLTLFRKHVLRYLDGLRPLNTFRKRLVTVNSAVAFLDTLDETVELYGSLSVGKLRSAEPNV